MVEKVNPSHPDKLADRIAGALVDYAYSISNRPKIAVEVLIGHSHCHIIAESSVYIPTEVVTDIVHRIVNENIIIDFAVYEQDKILSNNQRNGLKCGDNGIFKGEPVTVEEATLSTIARSIYDIYPTDGKYILSDNELIICQSNAHSNALKKEYPTAIINPLGDWTESINLDIDTGATNRKLGSDLASSITGGGIHGKDLSKADISVTIYCWLKAQELGENVEAYCNIGSDTVIVKVANKTSKVHFEEIVAVADDYIKNIGGFEKLAEWGLV